MPDRKIETCLEIKTCYTLIPEINLPHYSKYIYINSEKYDDRNIQAKTIQSYQTHQYKKVPIDTKSIESFDIEQNLYLHTLTGLILKLEQNLYTVIGKYKEDGEYIYVQELNQFDLIQAYQYKLGHDHNYCYQYMIINDIHHLDVVQLDSSLYVDLYSGYILKYKSNNQIKVVGKVEDGKIIQLDFNDYFKTAEYGFKIDTSLYEMNKFSLETDSNHLPWIKLYKSSLVPSN